jgi:DNA invertase Pin-like site-specific DNA recombinase
MKNNINTSETAVCYVRSAVAGPTLAEQEETCRQFAKYCGLEIRATYTDVGAGLKINPGLRDLIDGLHARPVGQVIIANAARLTRNRLLDGVLRQTFREAGVRLRIVDQDEEMDR